MDTNLNILSALPGSRDHSGRRLMTRSAIVRELHEIGIEEGDTVCAHVSLSKIGYVCGGAQSLIDALLDAVGGGALMMPTFSGEHSDPAEWIYPPVPADWIEPIRNAMPPYDPRLTPSRLMGTVPELFRHRDGVIRSPHPQSSFAACGARAAVLTGHHPMDYRFGPRSPLGKLAALDGKVLLLGAGPERASFVYLAQHMAGIGRSIAKSAPVLVNGRSEWRSYRDMAVDNRLVSSGVRYLDRIGVARTGKVGDAATILFRARPALAALLEWRWQDAEPPVPVRPATSLPHDWSEWLDLKSGP